ncbi:MAG: hypothetical protein CVU39_23750 [Chloroflexi bacterium HGW-Chloroflexi-10]|nr:MAG: hypothetical protein CVU39_23750 [Chloroflexi bacterium HGW-Chloroflexi-10]
MKMAKSLQNSHVTCPECQVGSYHLKLVTYYTWMGEELITVPDFPCWVCDVCKRYDYDQKALSELNVMLSSNIGRTVEKGIKNSRSKLPTSRSRRPHQIE